jgi:hypothetical protein
LTGSTEAGGKEASLHLMFSEVNDHIRATDAKHLRISLGYIGLLPLTLSIIAGFDAGASSITDASWAHLLAYGTLIIVGCMTVFVQDAYRGWKKHYIVVSSTIAQRLPLEDPFLPYWLKRDPWESPYVVKLSADNALTYFTVLTTALLLVIFDIALYGLIDSPGVSVPAMCAAVLVWGGWMLFVRIRVYKRAAALRDEIETQRKQGFATAG